MSSGGLMYFYRMSNVFPEEKNILPKYEYLKFRNNVFLVE
jgi:hypothetical protein